MSSLFDLLPIALTQSDLSVSLMSFMQQGGQVLWWLAAVVAVSLMLVIERILYLVVSFPKQKAQWIANWQQRDDHSTWFARSIREGWLAQANQSCIRTSTSSKYSLLFAQCLVYWARLRG